MKATDRPTAEGILYTDQYQLTMAQLYFRLGLHEKRVQFDYFYRTNPNYGSHQAGYCISAGLEWLLDWMQSVSFRDEDIAYLRQQKDNGGNPLFAEDFLAWLRTHGRFDSLTMYAIPEGRVVHPNVPLVIIEGPLAMAQILETSLLNHLNYPTLIATRASRISQAGRGQLLMEFGMRRGHERGVNAGTRAALIGGADFSSNAGMSHLLGLPPKGTHAHSMVQLFTAVGETELTAFQAYADLYPDDCLLLVDTINTLESGIPNAIKVFEKLRQKGHKPIGIRLDSGDLAYLAVQAAKMLDKAGFPDTTIVLSNDLDEMTILQILAQIRQEAAQYQQDAEAITRRLAFGVGTQLIVSEGKSALGGVYKLVAVQEGEAWLPAIKISENPIKTPNPGHKRAWRIYDERGQATADLLTLATEAPPSVTEPILLQHPTDYGVQRRLEVGRVTAVEPLHQTILQDGQLIYDLPDLPALRARRQTDLDKLDAGVKRLINPHIYHVSLSPDLWQLKQTLIRQAQHS
jgi:nicotinate phosphoribosyltransferase